jgi:hypothetical protein
VRASCIPVQIQLNRLYEGLNLPQLLGQFGAPFLTTRLQDGRLLDEMMIMMMMVYYCLSTRTPLLNTHTFTPVESELNTLSTASADPKLHVAGTDP